MHVQLRLIYIVHLFAYLYCVDLYDFVPSHVSKSNKDSYNYRNTSMFCTWVPAPSMREVYRSPNVYALPCVLLCINAALNSVFESTKIMGQEVEDYLLQLAFLVNVYIVFKVTRSFLHKFG